MLPPQWGSPNRQGELTDTALAEAAGLDGGFRGVKAARDRYRARSGSGEARVPAAFGPLLESGAKMRYIEGAKSSKGVGKCYISEIKPDCQPSSSAILSCRQLAEEYNPL